MNSVRPQTISFDRTARGLGNKAALGVAQVNRWCPHLEEVSVVAVKAHDKRLDPLGCRPAFRSHGTLPGVQQEEVLVCRIDERHFYAAVERLFKKRLKRVSQFRSGFVVDCDVLTRG